MADLFNRILTEAVADISKNGFDSTERVTYWIERLKEAAFKSLIPSHLMREKLVQGLRMLYRRAIERGGILQLHRGVGRFTPEKLAPQLRSVLDRHIMASANLIKLNRERAVQETIQRFSGWATSVPAGGTKAADKRDTKRDVRKSLARLPFEERRVLIDQGHKFLANLDDTLAVAGGAIAGIWRSRWRQPGYNYREDHKERDGKVFVIRGNWALQKGLMKLAGHQYQDEITKPGEEVFCRCRYEFVYNLRDLPEEMLTQKGREALRRVRIGAGVKTARADDASLLSKADVDYVGEWPYPETQCRVCSMFIGCRGLDDINACTLVEGSISTTAHCGRFEAKIASGHDGGERNIDRDHDVRWMAVKSADGKITYVDRTLPTEIENNGKLLDPANPLDEHETAEYDEIKRLTAVFMALHDGEPSGADRRRIYVEAHYKRGIPAEHQWLRSHGYDVDEYEAWCRGELSRLENRDIVNPPSDPHVRPMPHDRRELEAVI